MRLYQRPLLLILCFFAAISAKALTASFTADVLAGCAPLAVNFTNTSTGATSYSWNFGVGTSTLTSPGTTYHSPGTYTVTLTAYSGSSSTTASVVVTVYPRPTVNFTANDTAVCPGTPITFTSTSVGGTPGPVTCNWAFGDGSIGTGISTAHPYYPPGYYSVVLSVTNSQGCDSSLTLPNYIHVFTPPSPSFSASPSQVCVVPGSTTFTSTSTGAGPLSYYWRFGNGNTSTSPTPPPQTYSSVGTYSITLRVTDANGCVDSTVGYLSAGTLAASFTSPPDACLNSSVTFTNTSASHGWRNWNYGDGSPTDTALNGVHTYTAAGTYTVTLSIANGVCSTSVAHTITIQPSPAIGLSFSPVHPCPAPVTQTFTGTVAPGSTVLWDFGDGTTGAGNPVSHTYSNRGVKHIQMFVTSVPLGCTDTLDVTDTIYDLIVNMAPSPTAGCVPLTVGFTVTAKTKIPDTTAPAGPYPYGVVSTTWTFGDGSPSSSSPSPSHTYTNVGVYPVTLTLVTGNGCTVVKIDTIRVGAPTEVSSVVTPTHVCFHHPVYFTTTTIVGPVDHLYWNFGDSSSGYMAYPPVGTEHNFVIPGTFTNTVIPYYNGCPGTPFVVTTPVVVDSPKAIMYITHLCTPKTKVAFIDSSIGATSIIWLFGDGDTSTLHSPIHNYPALGTYTVCLCAYNAASGCYDTDRVVLNLTGLNPDFVGAPLNICTGDTVHFTSSYVGTSAPVQYRWLINNVFTYGDTLEHMVDTFLTRGFYSIKLVVKDRDGCYDTVNKPNYIRVGRPDADFIASPVTVCVGSPVIFTDASIDICGFSNFNWDFGDGTNLSSPTSPVSHAYATPGTYTVTEIVTDVIGCMDTMVKANLITVTQPTASFLLSTLHPCPGAVMTCTNTSSLSVVSWKWTFGDGDTSTLASPSHIYSVPGSYTVRLIVKDGNGCSDTMETAAGAVVSDGPSASFTLTDTFAVCTPLTVGFTSTSTGASSHNWNFGPGMSSVLTTGSNMFTAPGVYPVTLVVTDAYGCTDTAIRNVKIFGYAGAFTYDTLFGCAPLTVNFSAVVSNVSNLKWDFHDGYVVSSGVSPTITHTYNTPGAYVPKLILSDNTGCQASSLGIDTIKVDGIIPKISTNPTPVCVHGTFNFVDSSKTYWSPVTSWIWNYDTITTTLQSPTWTYDVPGTYTVSLQATNAWGCQVNYNSTVTIYPPPVITAGGDTTVCVGDPATLTGYGGVSYSWAGPSLGCANCNPANATPGVPSTYTVTGTDVRGCKNTDTVRVLLRTHTTSSASGEAEVCKGIPVRISAFGGTKYTWIPAEGISDPHSSNPLASPATSMTYSVVVQLAGCIPDTSYVTVTVRAKPVIDAGKDQWLPEGSTAKIDATGSDIQSVRWTNTETLSCDTCMSVVASMLNTTTYAIEATSPWGCKAIDSVTIYLYCSNSQIFIPNSFTPNKDGQNDIFYPRGKGIKEVKVFRVYNRWGELMHEKLNCQLNDPAAGWDGSYLGDVPRHDVYVYYIEATCNSDEPIFLKGDVTILR